MSEKGDVLTLQQAARLQSLFEAHQQRIEDLEKDFKRLVIEMENRTKPRGFPWSALACHVGIHKWGHWSMIREVPDDYKNAQTSTSHHVRHCRRCPKKQIC